MGVLFRKESSNAIACPKCKRSHFIEGSDCVPYKVLWQFPLIPHLKCMFKCFSLVKLMFWHDANKSQDGMVRSVCDSKAWTYVDNTWLNLEVEKQNIRLGLAFDGVNPYVNLSTNHSTWLVFFLNYNLPPWLITKRFFCDAYIINTKEKICEKW